MQLEEETKNRMIAVEKIANTIWSKYDKDNNGHIDKDEFKAFMVETM